MVGGRVEAVTVEVIEKRMELAVILLALKEAEVATEEALTTELALEMEKDVEMLVGTEAMTELLALGGNEVPTEKEMVDTDAGNENESPEDMLVGVTDEANVDRGSEGPTTVDRDSWATTKGKRARVRSR